MPVVWISGGARRLGKGLALRFAERGFDVSLTYRTSMEEAQHVQWQIQALGRACHIAECDVNWVCPM
jgi:NAD(P)-dependent dehydrogenase (short-subunit alcohol dehydrogenase family)